MWISDVEEKQWILGLCYLTCLLMMKS
jgi:hypothetical protein